MQFGDAVDRNPLCLLPLYFLLVEVVGDAEAASAKKNWIVVSELKYAGEIYFPILCECL